MNYYLGADIGSVNTKLALIDDGGGIAWSGVERIASSPRLTALP